MILMFNKYKSLLISLLVFLLLIIFCIITLSSIRSTLFPCNATNNDPSKQTLHEVIYIGEHFTEVCEDISLDGIELLTYQPEEQGIYHDKVILIDVLAKSVNYSELKSLADHNSLYFINVESMETISKIILESDSYDVFLPSDQNSKNCVRISSDRSGKKKTLVFGYTVNEGHQYDDLIEKMRFVSASVSETESNQN